MTAKSKAKSKSTSKGKSVLKTKSVSKSKGAVKPKGKETVKRAKPVAKAHTTKTRSAKAVSKLKTTVSSPSGKVVSKSTDSSRVAPVVVKRTVTPVIERKRKAEPSVRAVNQFAFMKAPITDNAFEVGDSVEVFCDHEKGRERVRGWIRGIVVQVDNKMVAVQFRSNVFLTDGWMVPDRILWYPLTSEHIRTVPGKKSKAKKDFIPDY